MIYRDVCTTGPVITLQPYFLPTGTTPTVNPEALAASATSQIEFSVPVAHFGPEPLLAVNRWVYLWVDDPGNLTATATAGAVTVTATATLSSIDWSMGEPASNVASLRIDPTFSCDGPGIDPGPDANANVDYPQAAGTCAYRYTLKSLPERTAGTGMWNVTSTANWTVTWTSNIGVGGVIVPDPLTSTTPVEVGEWRSELVAGPPN